MIQGVEKRELSNGLKVLVRPDPKVSVACVLTWVNCGYFDEPDELTGISHLIEHLFFKGTPTRGVGQIAKETKAIGGYLNASTIYDHTNYYVMVPSANALKALEIQADALQNPLFDLQEMEKEKKVIVQEMKRKLDTPHAFSREKLFELSFEQHAMRRWRIGTPEQLMGFDRDTVQSFYERHYVPENITLVVAGDVDSEAVFEQVERLYGHMPSAPAPEKVRMVEPTQQLARMTRIHGTISRAFVKMGFHGPTNQEADYFSMSALSVLLGKGRSSRLYRSLKEEKALVHGIGSTTLSYGDAGFMMFEAESDTDRLAEVEEELWGQIAKISYEPPTAQELQKVRNVVESNFFREKEDVMGQAYGLAYFESLGGYEKAIEYVNGMREVTIESMVEAAKKYLRFSKMNLLEYVPKILGKGAPTKQRLKSLQKRIEQRSSDLEPQEWPHSPKPREKFFGGASGPSQKIEYKPSEFSLPSGAKFVHIHNPSLPLISVNVRFMGGRLDETESSAGLTHFTLRNSLKGTETHTAEELAFQIESLGMALGIESSADGFGYSMNVLKDNFNEALSLLSQVVLHPQFPENEIEKERFAMLANIRRVEEDMFRYPIELFYRALFGMHPYGLPRHGNSESVNAFTRNQMMSWHEELFAWEKMVISVVGDIEANPALERILEHFSLIEESAKHSRAQLFPVVPNRECVENMVEKSRHQTAFALGFKGVDVKDPQYYSLEVLRNALAGMGGRLFHELRELRSLAYSVTAFNIALLRGGAFFTYVATDPGQEEEVKNRLLNELERVKTGRITEEEFSMAQNFTKGSHAISMQSNSAVAYLLSHNALLDRSFEEVFSYDDKIDKVTVGSVVTAASEVFDPQKSALGGVRGVSESNGKER